MEPEEFKSSRLVVKNLPNAITGDKLHKVFSKEGEITDLQLKFKKNGKFRNFAFVGFKTVEEAEKVKQSLDNTCIGKCKILIEYCRGLNDDPNAVKPGKEEDKRGTKSTGKSTKGDQEKDDDPTVLDEFTQLENDPEFVEFMESQRNVEASKRKIWENDDLKVKNDFKEPTKKKAKVEGETKTEEEKKKKPVVKGTFTNTVKIKRFPPKSCKKSIIKQFMAPLRPFSIRVDTRQKGIAFLSFKTEEEVNKALGKNRNVFQGHVVTVLRYENKNEEPEIPVNPKGRVEKQVSEDVLVDTGRLFVRNLYYKCTEEDLEKLFSPYGPIAEVHLSVDRETQRIKGFGFVTFVFPEHAIKAFSELDGTIFQGRTLHLLPGEAKPPGKETHLEGGSSFKREKELENKSKASKGYNWNSLFLNFNAISDIISERYNVTKGQLLTEGKSSESIPVRMALAETQIVNETANYLKENGVKLDSFKDGKSARSKTTFLIKNLPAKTEIEELKKLMAEHGAVKSIILPPLAVTAIVEAENPVEARKLFKKLAYCNFNLVPLYLEWAPVDVLGGHSEESSENKQPVDNRSTSKPAVEVNPCEEDTTILIKGLNFSTTEESLKDHFSKCGTIYNATISKKKAADGTLKSLGYGFIQFKERRAAQKAMKSLQNSVLDDFTLELQLSRVKRDKTDLIRTERANKPRIETQTGSKIMVRNIAFEVKEKDIEQLFEVFGKLKFVRLPKKIGPGGHKGFGFVDFVNKEDAKKAFDALSLSTHLLGRRLVLEWAKEDDNQAHESLESASRKSKFFIDTEPSKKLKKSFLKEELNKSKKDNEDLYNE